MRVAMRATVSALGALLLVVAAALVAVVLQASPAAAECPPDPVDEVTGLCASVDVTIPVDPPDPTTGPVGDPGPGAPSCPGAPGGQCQQGNAWWSTAGQCYAYPLDPQPTPGSPQWQAIAGNATEGTLMGCANGGEVFFVPQGEEGGIPDARTIALNAVDQVPFVTPDLNTAPASDFYTYITLENWLWVPSEQWRPVQAQVTVGGTTVTVTGEPVRSEWDMGDGSSKSCYDSGRPWVKGMSDAAQTACSYAYTDLESLGGDRRTIAGQLVYDVRWSCTGACSAPGGPLGEYSSPSSTSCLTVYQRQTVVVAPGGGSGSNDRPRSLCP